MHKCYHTHVNNDDSDNSDVDSEDESVELAQQLLHAISDGNVHMVNQLAHRCGQVWDATFEYRSNINPLYYACFHNKPHMVQTLLLYPHFNVNIPHGRDKDTVLSMLCKKVHGVFINNTCCTIVQQLINHPTTDLNIGYPLINVLMGSGCSRCAASLLTCGRLVHVNARHPRTGVTALHVSTHKSITQMLIKYPRIQTHITTKFGETPLMYVANRLLSHPWPSRMAVFNILLQLESTWDRGLSSVFHNLCDRVTHSEHCVMLQSICNNASPDDLNRALSTSHGYSGLSSACRSRNTLAVYTLLEHKRINVHTTPANTIPPLILAIRNNCPDIVFALLRYGAPLFETWHINIPLPLLCARKQLKSNNSTPGITAHIYNTLRTEHLKRTRLALYQALLHTLSPPLPLHKRHPINNYKARGLLDFFARYPGIQRQIGPAIILWHMPPI